MAPEKLNREAGIARISIKVYYSTALKNDVGSFNVPGMARPPFQLDALLQ